MEYKYNTGIAFLNMFEFWRILNFDCMARHTALHILLMCDVILRFWSNHDLKFRTEVTGAIMLSPTLRPPMFTLASCFLVPIIMNSVLLSFRRSLSLIIHDRIACMHCSIASTASFCKQAELALNDRYSWVSSAYACDCGRQFLITSKSLLA